MPTAPEGNALTIGLLLTLATVLIAASAARALRLRNTGAQRSHWGMAGRIAVTAALASGAATCLRLAAGHAFGAAPPAFPWDLVFRLDLLGLVAAAAILAFVETEASRVWLLLGAAVAGALTWVGAAGIEPLAMQSPLEPLTASFAAAVICTLMLSSGPMARLAARVHRDAVHEAFDHVLIGDSAGRILYVSDSGRAALGIGPAPSKPFERADQAPKAIRDLLDAPETRNVRLKTTAGRVLEAQTTELLPQGFRKQARGVLVRDVTGAYRSQRRLVRLANYDSLTGLSNRRLLLETLAQVLVTAQKQSHRAALFYIDLDDFKAINDTLGHAAGDAMLKALSARLLEGLQPGEVARLGVPKGAELTVARLAGDEFAVIAPKIADSTVASELARWILEISCRPLELADHVLTPSASVGIAVFPEDGGDVDTLLRRADSALYVAKSRGRQRFARYDASFDEKSDRARRLETCLRDGIEQGELRLVYQPRVDALSGVLVGAEALLRWKSPDLGDVGPAEFIPVAEERGLISEIGKWCLDEACRQMRTWADAGLRTIPVSVNVSSAQFNDSGLQRVVSDALKAHNIAPEQLELELTESLLLDQRSDVELVLRDLRSVGVRIALDDFGTGYSALSYLNRFSLDVLKMDRGLLRDIDSNPSALGVASAVVSMAQSLGLTVVAEGVDMEEQLEILRDLGCDQIQGFLFAPGLPPEEVVPFIGRADGEVPAFGPGMRPHGQGNLRLEAATRTSLGPDLRDPIDFDEETPHGTTSEQAVRGRVLLVDDGRGALGPVALRLVHLGTEIHYAAKADEAHLFVAQEKERIRLIAAPPTIDLRALRVVNEALTQITGGQRSLVVIGDRPDDHVRDQIREVGVDRVLWTPFNDAELRYLIRSAMSLPEEFADRREPRVPVDLVAKIQCGSTRAVAVVSSLSTRGAFIELSEPIPLGSSLKIEIDLVHDNFRGFARVVHVETDGPTGIGVTFYGTSRENERILRKTTNEIETRYIP